MTLKTALSVLILTLAASYAPAQENPSQARLGPIMTVGQLAKIYEDQQYQRPTNIPAPAPSMDDDYLVNRLIEEEERFIMSEDPSAD